MALSIACTNEQKVTVICTPITGPAPGFPGGRPAGIDGALKVTVQSGDGTVEQDPNFPLRFKAVSGESLGDTVYLVEADADLGAETVETISDLVTLTVTGARARNLGLQAGPVEPKEVTA